MTRMALGKAGPLGGPGGRRVAAHREELLQVLQSHGITRPEVFGSVARGDDHDGSDIDLLVDFAPGTDIVDIIGIRRELEAILGVSVDLVPRRDLTERVRSHSAKDVIAL